MRGAGPQELALDRSASAAQWVIAPLGGVGPTTVSFGITVEGAYVAALGVAGAGLLLLVVAVELLRPRRPAGPEPSGAPRPARPRPPATPGAAQGRPPRAHPRHRRLALVAVLLAGGCQLPEPSTEATATLARTKVSLTAAELPALYASYDGRRARALRAAGPPAYRDGPWRAADRGLALAVDRYETAARRVMRLGPGRPPAHTGLRVYAARFDAYPMWAMVAARTPGRRPGGARAGPRLGDLAVAGGGADRRHRRPAGGRPSHHAADRARPRRRDRRAGRLARLPHRRATRTGCVVDDASRAWRRAMADLGSRAIFRDWEVRARAVGGPVRVVSVADGRLAVVALRVATRLRGRPDLAVRWNPPYGRLRAGRGGVLVVDELAVGLVHLPDRGRPDAGRHDLQRGSGRSALIRASRARRLSRRTTASTTSMPPLGEASACSSSGRLVTRRCGVRVAAHRLARSTSCGVPKRVLERLGVLVGPLLQHAEDRAAVVVDDHDREVGPLLAGAEDQAGRVVQEGHVAHQGQRAGAARTAQGGADRGGDGAVDAGEAAVGDDLAPVAHGVARDHQVQVADRAGGADVEQPAGRQRPADRPGHLVRREVGLGGQQRGRAGGPPTGRPRATPPARPGRRAPPRTGRPPGRPGTGAPTRSRAARSDTTSTSSRPSSRVTGRDSVGWPATTTRSMRSPSSLPSSSR